MFIVGTRVKIIFISLDLLGTRVKIIFISLDLLGTRVKIVFISLLYLGREWKSILYHLVNLGREWKSILYHLANLGREWKSMLYHLPNLGREWYPQKTPPVNSGREWIPPWGGVNLGREWGSENPRKFTLFPQIRGLNKSLIRDASEGPPSGGSKITVFGTRVGTPQIWGGVNLGREWNWPDQRVFYHRLNLGREWKSIFYNSLTWDASENRFSITR
jgi:hypothetical protein